MCSGKRFITRRPEEKLSGVCSAPQFERKLMNSVNENLIRDVVAEVMARLNGGPAPARTQAEAACGCQHNGPAIAGKSSAQGKFGVFQDANEACAAAQEAFVQLQK